ncbi:(3R)-hydroxyacyl-ACP dehydratase subunit HadA [Rhodococcus sp. ARC_M12]|uniref:(3R)-hydroxyacyl-ACP dehydratase subunit HadA n=1 Tax=unclassified Rhodococcus (in: high G+C Gram-positive bacteria) TaxID=192944 RepID=UPI000344FF11|nr:MULTISPECIES: (3R)-hydroxyacyl-ACP dehydratase subunit HadA [unclassified Rhodococcus (in: high G+C Gram-positive bacteria)]MCJ0979717.1 (3R)-hydroxyacyl-ACP dehydratase subunit HadA [Rhodococcus sp. ARC_M12]
MDVSAHAASMVGFHYRVDDFYEVGREKVREYARAVQDFHPAHHDEDAAKGLGYDGLLAPLTFISLVGIIAQTRMFKEVITGYDPSQILQTDQRLEFHRPIQVGDRLICDVHLESFRQMSGSDIMTTKNIVTDQNGEVVQTTWTTIVARTGGEVDENIAHAVKEVIMHGAS